MDNSKKKTKNKGSLKVYFIHGLHRTLVNGYNKSVVCSQGHGYTGVGQGKAWQQEVFSCVNKEVVNSWKTML